MAKKITKKPKNFAASAASSPKKKEAFLEVFRRTGNITYAAKAAGIDRSTHHKRWMKHPDYAEQFENAREEAADVLEAEALRRAVQGTEKPVFYQGSVCGHIREYSDVLLIFLLKGNRPNKFRERFEHGALGGGPLQISVQAAREIHEAVKNGNNKD